MFNLLNSQISEKASFATVKKMVDHMKQEVNQYEQLISKCVRDLEESDDMLVEQSLKFHAKEVLHFHLCQQASEYLGSRNMLAQKLEKRLLVKSKIRNTQENFKSITF